MPALTRSLTHYTKQDRRLYPAYRLSRAKRQIYILALATWYAHVKHMHASTANKREIKSYEIEAGTLRHLAIEVRGLQLPYDIRLERCDWPTVSRALRHLYSRASATSPSASENEIRKQAFNLYHHWRKHKHCGYSKVRNSKAPVIKVDLRTIT